MEVIPGSPRSVSSHRAPRSGPGNCDREACGTAVSQHSAVREDCAGRRIRQLPSAGSITSRTEALFSDCGVLWGPWPAAERR